jgi:hypothetical protein
MFPAALGFRKFGAKIYRSTVRQDRLCGRNGSIKTHSHLHACFRRATFPAFASLESVHGGIIALARARRTTRDDRSKNDKRKQANVPLALGNLLS